MGHAAPGAQDSMGQSDGGVTPPNPAAAPSFGAGSAPQVLIPWALPACDALSTSRVVVYFVVSVVSCCILL